MFQFSEKMIAALLLAIYNGSITEYDLPENLYFAIADFLKQALYKGFGGSLTDFNPETIDFDLLQELRENIYMFSGAKTFQQVREMTDALTDSEGNLSSFADFKAAAGQIFDTYNDAYLRTEYDTAIGQGQMAAKWNDIEKNKDILPILVFDTKGNPCEECAPFEGFAAPVDDPIWDWLMPLLHFNCGCTVRQEEKDYKVSGSEQYAKTKDLKENVPETFRMNPGKDKVVFNADHPYFEVAPKDKGFAENNFDLPIPDKD